MNGKIESAGNLRVCEPSIFLLRILIAFNTQMNLSTIGISIGFSLLIAAPQALARGGPGGALGGAIEFLISVAIVAGVAAGLMAGRRRWARFAPYFIILVLVLAILGGRGFFTIFVLLPLSIFGAVFWSLSILISTPPSVSRSFGKKSEVESVGASRAGTRGIFSDRVRTGGFWIAATYLFWTLFSLANLKIFAFFAFPPIALIGDSFYAKFLPFLIPPFVFALLTTGAIVAGVFAKFQQVDGRVAAFLFNTVLLVVFGGAVELYKYHLISEKLSARHPEHVHVSSFFSSMLEAGGYVRSPHATFTENGQPYCWSYSTRDFFQCE